MTPSEGQLGAPVSLSLIYPSERCKASLFVLSGSGWRQTLRSTRAIRFSPTAICCLARREESRGEEGWNTHSRPAASATWFQSHTRFRVTHRTETSQMRSLWRSSSLENEEILMSIQNRMTFFLLWNIKGEVMRTRGWKNVKNYH